MKKTLMTALSLAVASGAGGETVESKSMALLFDNAGHGFALTGIVNKVAGGVRFMNVTGKQPDFWELEFSCKTGGTVKVQNHSRSRRTMRRLACGGAEFCWAGIDLPGDKAAVDVKATVALAKDGSSEWTLEVKNRSTSGWALKETSYPYLRNVMPAGEGDALVPTKNLGARFIRGFDSARLKPDSYSYPGWYTMVTAFHRKDAGLYFAAHDRDARIKTLSYLPGGGVRFVTLVENSGIAGRAAEGPRYPVVIAAYKGDWWQAARIYRKFAMTCPWTAKGPIAKRADFPKSMAETAMWSVVGRSVQEATNRMEYIRKRWSDVKVGVQWYNWHVQPDPSLDSLYPEFVPYPGMKEHFAFCRNQGLLAMPYVNGRIWDMQLLSYGYASRDACRDVDGSVQKEMYGSGFAVMCPERPLWQETLFKMGTNVVEGLGAPAIYYDQVTCSRPMPCYDPAHGHPAGGGSYWADGYRKALGRLHDRISPMGVPITSEGAAETWLDVVDGHLICGRASSPDDVPFLPAVYSGYTVYFGTVSASRGEPRAFFANLAKSTLWGCATGRWGYFRLFMPPKRRSPVQLEADRNADAIYACAKVRMSAADFLVYGHLEDEMRPLDAMPTVRLAWLSPVRPRPGKPEEYPDGVEMASVFGTVWRDVDNKRKAVLLANRSSEVQTVRFRMPRGCREVSAMKLLGQHRPKVESTADGVVSLSVVPGGFAGVVAPFVP